MIGSSVVPGLPNRWVMPSSLSRARNAERPVMRFIENPPVPAGSLASRGFAHHGDSAAGAQWSAVMAALHAVSSPGSKHPFMLHPLLLFRALPDHARKTLQRHQRFAGPGPFLQFLDRDMVERLAAGTPGKQRARDVDHMRRARALVNQRRAAARTEAARGFCRLVFVAHLAAQALAGGDADWFSWFCHFRFPSPPSLREAKRRSNPSSFMAQWIA